METKLFFTFLPGIRIKQILFLAFLFSGLSRSAFSQVTTQGTDFYMAFGQNYNRPATGGSYPVVLQIKIAASQATHVTFTFTHNNSTVSADIPAGEIHTLNLDDTQKTNVYNNSTGVSSKSLRIESDAPVSVYALNQSYVTTEASHVLPVTNLGTEYYHISYLPFGTYSEKTVKQTK